MKSTESPATAPTIVYLQRKRRPGRNFSLEQVFSDLRQHLSGDFNTRVWVAPFHSNGILRRLLIAICAAINQADINHVTGDINFATFFLRRNRTVLTIPDIGILRRTAGLKHRILRLVWFRLPVMRSKIVTVISHSTKEHLLEIVDCDASRIRVIPVAISSEFRKAPKSFNAQNPRILHVGTAPNKNLARVAQALAGVPCHLDVVGPLSPAMHEQLQQHHISYTSSQDLDAQEMLRRYHDCDLLLFPSTFEGFGMPILEANAVGRPVVTSNITSMPEVAGDAACLVDPHDVNSIRNGVLRVITDTEYRDSLIEAGYANVRRFHPETIAAMYRSVYAEVLGGTATAGQERRRPPSRQKARQWTR